MAVSRTLSERIKMKGLELGFSKVGITSADDFTEYEEELLKRPDYDFLSGLKKGARPRDFYPEAESIICAAYSYAGIKFPEELDRYIGRAYLSRSYNPLEESAAALRVSGFRRFLESSGCRLYSGDISVPMRAACARAGIVSFGKNNFAYTEEDGSFVILYTFITNKVLEYDEPDTECRCPPGCTKCIDACPSHAIISPGRLHPQNCLLLSHMRKDDISDEMQENTGTYIYGCDICQKACPRNKKILERASGRDPFLEELKKEFDLEKVLAADDVYYNEVIYPVMHSYISDKDIFRRNAAAALGNTNDPSHIPALKLAVQSENPMVSRAALQAVKKLSALSSE